MSKAWHVESVACRKRVMVKAWHVESVACRKRGMSKAWHVESVACRKRGMSKAWHVESMACRKHGMSKAWHVERESVACGKRKRGMWKDMSRGSDSRQFGTIHPAECCGTQAQRAR